MSKWMVIARREILETIRTKAFVISTILTPVLMGLMLFLPQALARTSPDVKIRVAVIDRTGRLLEGLDQELQMQREGDFADYLKAGGRRWELVPIADAERDPNGLLVAPGAPLKEHGAAALLDLAPEVFDGKADPRWYAANVTDFMPIRRVERALNAVLPRLRLQGTGVPAEQIRAGIVPVDLRTHKIGSEGQAQKSDFFREWIKAMLLAISLYAPTLMAGFALSRGLLEEKANRVIEVLVASVTPMQLMTGKILGQAVVILGQIGIWALAGMGTALFVTRSAPAAQRAEILSSITPGLLAWLVVFFLLGYLLYAALFAAVGAICTSEIEAQQVQTPLVLMLVIPMMLAIMIVRQPSGGMATALSFIPFFAPNVMLIRIALQPPPAWQVLTSLAILGVSIFLAFWAVSRIFRVGILMTGKRMTGPEILRWIRAR